MIFYRMRVCGDRYLGQGSKTKFEGLSILPNPLKSGEPCRDRTDNLLIKSQLLYLLS